MESKESKDYGARRAAAKRLGKAEVELQAAQKALQRDDCNENRQRYKRALDAMTSAQAEATALLRGWGLV
jgi:hypothetical protein